MLQPIIDAVLANLAPIIASLISAVVLAVTGLMFSMVRKLPAVVRAFADDLRVKALKTDTKADDIAAAVLVAIADALEAALNKELPKSKPKEPVLR